MLFSVYPVLNFSIFDSNHFDVGEIEEIIDYLSIDVHHLLNKSVHCDELCSRSGDGAKGAGLSAAATVGV